MDGNVMKLSELIRHERKEKKLSTYKLSELAGVKQSTISNIENEKIDPRWSTLEKLFKVLEIKIGKQ